MLLACFCAGGEWENKLIVLSWKRCLALSGVIHASRSKEEKKKKISRHDRRVVAAVFSESRCSVIHVPQSVSEGTGYCTTQLYPSTSPTPPECTLFAALVLFIILLQTFRGPVWDFFFLFFIFLQHGYALDVLMHHGSKQPVGWYRCSSAFHNSHIFWIIVGCAE